MTPHPEYPAAHAFITSSIMQVMGSVFGDSYRFTDHTYDFRNYPARSYTSFNRSPINVASRVYMAAFITSHLLIPATLPENPSVRQ